MTYEINLEAEVRFACKGDKQWAFMAKKKKKSQQVDQHRHTIMDREYSGGTNDVRLKCW